MEHLGKNTFDAFAERLKERQKKNKNKEYRSLWVKLNFALIKDSHLRKIGSSAFAVFMVLRSYMSKNKRESFPSLNTIAYYSGLSIKTVQKAIDTLVRHGWILKVNRVRKKNGKYGNTVYKILEKNLIRGSGENSFMKEPVV